MKSRILAYCIDAAYLLPLSAALRSVLEHWKTGQALEVFVLHSKLPKRARERIIASLPKAPFLKLHWLPIDSARVRGLRAGLYFSSANYFRLLLPDLLPSENSLLYLDADTIALADVSPLFDLFDDQLPLQACRDYYIGAFDHPLINLPRPEFFGVKSKAPYYNSGVLLMNLKRWRKENLGEKILRLGYEHPEILFLADQTPINIALYGRIGRLPKRWNAQTASPLVLDEMRKLSFVPQDLKAAKILHYTGKHKPWSLGRNLPQARPFHKVLARTAWG